MAAPEGVALAEAQAAVVALAALGVSAADVPEAPADSEALAAVAADAWAEEEAAEAAAPDADNNFMIFAYFYGFTLKGLCQKRGPLAVLYRKVNIQTNRFYGFRLNSSKTRVTIINKYWADTGPFLAKIINLRPARVLGESISHAWFL